MIVSINQPCYLPWLGYFHRVSISDIHIVLDSVQFEKNSFTNRNLIRTKQGSCWLTVPVKTKGQFGALAIHKLAISDDRWRTKHSRTVQFNYAKAPYFLDHAPFIDRIYGRSWSKLNELMREMTDYFLKTMEIHTKIMYSSEMNISGKSSDLLLNLCMAVKAKTYISGALGREYLQLEIFNDAGIKVLFQDYVHPTYQQAFRGFEPNMAALDLLFNCGPKSLEILMKDQDPVSA